MAIRRSIGFLGALGPWQAMGDKKTRGKTHKDVNQTNKLSPKYVILVFNLEEMFDLGTTHLVMVGFRERGESEKQKRKKVEIERILTDFEFIERRLSPAASPI